MSALSSKNFQYVDDHLGDGDIEVQIETQNCARKEDDENGECGILKVGHLDFHRSKFHSPSNRGVHRRGLEANGLPIS